jgi:nitrogen regulatory protein P-II 1
MKKIEAIIRPERFDDVKDALEKVGIISMNVGKVRGSGEQREFIQVWRAYKSAIYLIPKIKIEMVVRDEIADMAINEVLKAAWTGSVGDGVIYITPIDEAVRVRTGEKGVDAL